MRNLSILIFVGWVAVLTMSACASTATDAPPQSTSAPEVATQADAPQPATETPMDANIDGGFSSSSASAMVMDPPTEVSTAAPAMMVTPRGDALEASDPTTVVLGAGQPVLLEFFAFW